MDQRECRHHFDLYRTHRHRSVDRPEPDPAERNRGSPPAGPGAPTVPCTASAIRAADRQKTAHREGTRKHPVSLLLCSLLYAAGVPLGARQWSGAGEGLSHGRDPLLILTRADHSLQAANKRRDPHGSRLFAYAVMPCGRWSCVGRLSLIPGASCPPAEPHRPWP